MQLTYSDHMTTQPENQNKTINSSLDNSRNNSKEDLLKKVFFPLTEDPEIRSKKRNPTVEKPKKAKMRDSGPSQNSNMLSAETDRYTAVSARESDVYLALTNPIHKNE